MNLQDITPEIIKDFTDNSKIYERGKEYYYSGHVENINIKDSEINAVVSGNYGSSYTVKIEETGTGLDIKCNCPYEGRVCKHVVAVLLEYVNEYKGKENSWIKNYRPNRDKDKLCVMSNDLKSRLEQLSQKQLIDLILSIASRNENLERDLFLFTEQDNAVKTKTSKSFGLSIALSQIHEAFYISKGFIDYYAMPEVISKLQDILESTKNAHVFDKAEIYLDVVRKGSRAIESCDDSDGMLGDLIMECAEEYGHTLSQIELSVKDKQKRLQEMLEYRFSHDYGLDEGFEKAILNICNSQDNFDFVLDRIKKEIGTDRESYSYELLTDFLAKIYLKMGNVDEFLKIRENNLSSEDDYIQLANFWKDRKEEQKFVEILERGRIAISYQDTYGNYKLYDMLESYYEQKEDFYNLHRILMKHFGDCSSLDLYKRLEKLSQKIGNWETVELKLMSILGTKHASFLIDVLLYRTEYEKAIKIVKTRECQDDTKVEVAETVKNMNPEVSVSIYQDIINEQLSNTGRKYYQIAREYLKKLKNILLEIMQEPEQWEKYIENLRANNKHRPALHDEFKNL